MRTLDDALLELHRRGIISRESLFAFCQDADEVNKLLRGPVTTR